MKELYTPESSENTLLFVLGRRAEIVYGERLLCRAGKEAIRSIVIVGFGQKVGIHEMARPERVEPFQIEFEAAGHLGLDLPLAVKDTQ